MRKVIKYIFTLLFIISLSILGINNMKNSKAAEPAHFVVEENESLSSSGKVVLDVYLENVDVTSGFDFIFTVTNSAGDKVRGLSAAAEGMNGVYVDNVTYASNKCTVYCGTDTEENISITSSDQLLRITLTGFSAEDTYTFTDQTEFIGYDENGLTYGYDLELAAPFNVTVSLSSGYTVSYSTSYSTTPNSVSDVTTLSSATLPTLTYTGYTFGGWYYESTYQTKAQVGDTVSSNITLYAKWTENQVSTYSVSYVSSYATTPSTVTGQTKLTSSALPTLTYSGYTFGGWYYDSDYQTKANLNDTLTSNVTLYAKWTENSTEEPDTPKYVMTLTQAPDENGTFKVAVSLEGTLSVWRIQLVIGVYTSENCTEEEDGIDYVGTGYHSIEYATLPFTIDGWESLHPEYTFNFPNETFIVWASNGNLDNLEVTGLLGEFTFTMNSDVDEVKLSFITEETEYNDNICSTQTGDFAHVEFDVCDPITISRNQGYEVSYVTEHATAPETLTNQTTLTSSALPTLTYSGYTFGGWYYDSDCQTKANVDDELTENVTLYAKWTENSTEEPDTPKYVMTLTQAPDENGTFKVAVSLEGTLSVWRIQLVIGVYTSENCTEEEDDIDYVGTGYHSIEYATLPFTIDGWESLHSEYTFNFTNEKAIVWASNGNLDNLEVTGLLGEFTFTMNSDVDEVKLSFITEETVFNDDICSTQTGDFAHVEFDVCDPITISRGQGYEVSYVTEHATAPEALTNQTIITSSALPTLSQYGYIFGGWYYDSDCQTKANLNDTLTNDVTLYAKWTVDESLEDPETPTFVMTLTQAPDENGTFKVAVSLEGTLSVWRIQLVIGVYTSENCTEEEDDIDYVGTGYHSIEYATLPFTIDGWESLHSEYTFNFTNEKAIVWASNGNLDNLEVTGLLGEFTFTMNSNVDEVKLSFITEETVFNDDICSVQTGDFEYVSFKVSDPITIRRDLTYVDITFDAAGGTINGAEILTIPYGSGLESLPTATKEGYEFLGWYLEDTLVELPLENITSDITLTAKWSDTYTPPVLYTVTLDAGEGSIAVDSYTAKSIDVEPRPVAPSGKVFTGWVDEEGNSVYFPYNITEDVTLYATYISQSVLIEEGTIFLEDIGENRFKVSLYNPDNLPIQLFGFELLFGGNAEIVDYLENDDVYVYPTDNTVEMQTVEAINNSYIFLCEIEIFKLNNATSATVSVADMSGDIEGFDSNEIEITFVYPDDSQYYYLEASDSVIDTKIFEITLMLHNAALKKHSAGSLNLVLPDGITYIGFKNGDSVYSKAALESDGLLEYNPVENGLYCADRDIFIFTLVFRNDSVNGLVKFDVSSKPLVFYYTGGIEEHEYIEFKPLEITLNTPQEEDGLSNDTSLKMQLEDGEVVTITEDVTDLGTVNYSILKPTLTAYVHEKSYVGIYCDELTLGGAVCVIPIGAGLTATISVVVLAEDGTSRTYTIKFSREDIPVSTAELIFEIDYYKEYDIYNTGLIPVEIYLDKVNFNLYKIGLTLDYDTTVLDFVGSETKINTTLFSFSVNDALDQINFSTTDTYLDDESNIHLATIYFKLKTNDSSIVGDYEIGIDSVSKFIEYPMTTADFTFSGTTLIIVEGTEPNLTGIKVTKHNNEDVVLYNSTEFDYDAEGNIIIPELAYEHNEFDVYFSTGPLTVIYIVNTSEPYSSVYRTTFNNEYELTLSIGVNYIESWTTRLYNIKFTRDEGDSDSSLSDLDVTFNLNTYQASFTSSGENTYSAAIDTNIDYIYRNGVTVSATSSSNLATITINDVVTAEKSFDLNVGTNQIVVKVESQNGKITTYNLTLKVNDKLQYVITDDNIEELSKIFDNVKITSSDVTLTVKVNDIEVNSYDKVIEIYNSNDELVTEALKYGSYKVKAYIKEDDLYQQSSVIEKEFEITKVVEDPDNPSNPVVFEFELEYLTTEYDGTIKKPNVTVAVNDVVISSDEYTLEYGDENYNINASTTLPYVIVKPNANGNYSFAEKTINFTITPKSIKDLDVIGAALSKTYTGNPIVLEYSDITIICSVETLDSDDFNIKDYENNTNVGTAKVIVEGKGNYKDELEITFEIKNITMPEPDDDSIEYYINGSDSEGKYSVLYDGEAHKPTITLIINGITIDDTLYDLKYFDDNNDSDEEDLINAGTKYISIVGDGNTLVGTLEKVLSYSITALSFEDMDESELTIEPVDDKEYTGSKHEPKPKVYYKGVQLTENQDFTYAYGDNTNVGNATVTIVGKGNFAGGENGVTITFEITAFDLSAKNVTFDLEYDTTVYNGKKQEPQVSNIKIDDVAYSRDLFDVSYENNKNVGLATVTISFKDKVNYTGSQSKQFEITQLDLSDERIMIKYTETGFNPPVLTYTGKIQLPEFRLCLVENGEIIEYIGEECYDLTSPLGLVTAGTKQLKFVAKTVEYNGTNNFKGERIFEFEMEPRSLTDADIVVTEIEDQLYTGEDILVQLEIKYGNFTLVEYVDDETAYDYKVSYENNKNVGQATITITGYGNYKDYIEVNFEIVLGEEPEIRIEYDNTITYNGTEISLPTVKLYVNDVLISSSEYKCEWETEDLTNVGKKEFSITAEENSNIKDLQFENQIVEITTKKINDYTVTVKSIDPQIYTGSEIEPEVIVTDTAIADLLKQVLLKDTDFKVSYANNTNVGTATVTISGKGNYSGSRELIFKIDPATSDVDGKVVFTLVFNETDLVYTGEELKPTFEFKINDKVVNSTDYDYQYKNNTNAGDGILEITGKNNLAGFAKEYEFVISPRKIATENVLEDGFTTSSIPVQSLIDGKAEPTVDLYYNGNKLVLFTTAETPFDFKMEYENNDSVTTEAIARIVANGNYTGTYEIKFTIALPSDKVVELTQTEFEYTGSEIKPGSDYLVFKDSSDNVITGLVEGTDYVITGYKDNINVKYEGDNPIQGSTIEIKFSDDTVANVMFKITPKVVNDAFLDGIEESYAYTGQEIVIDTLKVYTDSTKEVEITTYDKNYENNINVSVINKATVTITLNGNYSGTAVGKFSIVKAQASDSDITIEFTQDYEYTGEELTIEYLIYLNDTLLDISSQMKIYEDIDRTKEITEVINAGTYYVTITFDTNNVSGTKNDLFEVRKLDVLNRYIEYINDLKYQGAQTTAEFTDSDIKIVDKYNNQLVLNQDYKVIHDPNCLVDDGYSLKIEGINNYSNVLTGLTYNIIPVDITITAVDKSSAYLEELQDLTYEVTGDLKDDASTIGITLACEVTVTSTVGDYTITVNCDNKNYNITLVNGTYKVIKATISGLEFENQAASYTGEMLLPKLKGELPTEVTYDFFTDALLTSKFEGAKDIDVYTVYIGFTIAQPENYNMPEIHGKSIQFEIIIPQVIELADDSSFYFIFEQIVVDARGRTKTYLKTYHELGYEHGVDDLANNTNGIDNTRIILGQIDQKTSLDDFILNFKNTEFLRITRYRNKAYKVVYENGAVVSGVNAARTFVGTGWIVEFVVGDQVLDTLYLSVLGDINSDGNINVSDLALFNQYLSTGKDSEGNDYQLEYRLAMRIANRGTISTSDTPMLSTAISTGTGLSKYFYVPETTQQVVTNSASPTETYIIEMFTECEVIENINLEQEIDSSLEKENVVSKASEARDIDINDEMDATQSETDDNIIDNVDYIIVNSSDISVANSDCLYHEIDNKYYLYNKNLYLLINKKCFVERSV